MKKKQRKICIIGSGLSAAVIAEQAITKGYSVTVYQTDDYIGGLCADQAVFYPVSFFGPHIFHTNDKEIWEYVTSKADWLPYINSPLAEYEGKYYNLPINLHTLYQMYGTADIEELKKLLAKDGVDLNGHCYGRNAEEACIMRVGKKLYEALFKAYTEKQWKTEVKNVDGDVLRRVPVRFTWNNNYFNDLYQAVPANGYSDFIRKLFEGAKIIQGSVAKELLSLDEFTSQLSEKYDKIFICEAPDKDLKYVFGRIPYLKTKFVPLNDSKNSKPAAVINHCDHSTEATRTTSYNYLRPVHQTSSGMKSRISEIPLAEDLDEKGEARPEEGIVYYGDEWTACCYPARDTNIYNKYKQYCEQNDYILCGRLAENKYLNMDQAIKNAIEKAKKYL